jgi:hypothetical protein
VLLTVQPIIIANEAEEGKGKGNVEHTVDINNSYILVPKIRKEEIILKIWATWKQIKLKMEHTETGIEVVGWIRLAQKGKKKEGKAVPVTGRGGR